MQTNRITLWPVNLIIEFCVTKRCLLFNFSAMQETGDLFISPWSTMNIFANEQQQQQAQKIVVQHKR